MGWPWGQSWAHHDGMPVPIVTPTAPWLGSLVGRSESLPPSGPHRRAGDIPSASALGSEGSEALAPGSSRATSSFPGKDGGWPRARQKMNGGSWAFRPEGVCSQIAASPGRLPDSSHWPGRLWKLLEGAGPLPLSHLGPGAAWPLLAEGAGEWAGPGWCCSWIHVCPGGRDWPGEGPGSVCCMSVRAGGDVPQSVPGLCPQAVLRTGLA